MKQLSLFYSIIILLLSFENGYSQCIGAIPNSDWDLLIRHKPELSISNAAAARNRPVLSIYNGIGDVNLDYWAITISKMPIVNGRRLTAEQLLSRIRGRFSTYIDRSLAVFSPSQPLDEPAWRAGTVGALLTFTIKVPTIPGPTSVIAPVMLSASTPTYWRFVTVGQHPVSGSREFGIRNLPDGKWEVYTRGADRISSRHSVPMTHMIFEGGDQIWEKFQDKVGQDITSIGGEVSNYPETHGRYCWSSIISRIPLQ
ncbi:hypothetical protein EXU57_24420 [Segetibacter sp. 3557_3]|uniref:hypothetical protein n=1 Tax=Segetibacter sp. 3557_3 TaxID=2547429 RepID=UPI001058A1E3|nr:hypothetical protein [Segetibacter sp. 3557_3]TDH18069.1 hypothetical protein EXU57_24420 [Segetibacter sp. 3557_3]